MHLTRTDDHSAEVDALAARSGGRVGLAGVLDDLDRRLRRTWAPGLAVRRAWAWDRADSNDRSWWPQGVSCGPEPRLLGVTWYAEAGGSRLSILDLDARRYRHVRLVVPTADGWEPLRVHAGGLAWHEGRVYVAGTRAGLWVCELDDVVRLDGEYLLPVRHRLAPSEPFRFSFVSASDAGLLVGEYDNAGGPRRLADVSHGGGEVTVHDAGVRRAQGAVHVRDRWFLTASHGPWRPGSLWSGSPGALRERRWATPMGPEDLAYDAARDVLWTVTEHPHRRWITQLRLP